MIGGNVDFTKTSNTSPSTAFQTRTSFNLALSTGYFIVDKFAAGIRPTFDFQSYNTGTVGRSTTRIDLGPFIRYYFLSSEKRFNIFSEISYQYQLSKNGVEDFGGTHGYKVLAGPVVYLNNIIGIEFTFGYSSHQTVAKDGYINNFRSGIGLQIHLESSKE